MGPLSQVAALLLMLSAAHSVKLRQECDIGLQVGCPSEADEQPWVSCSRVNCSVSAKRTWFIGELYKRVDCLEAEGKMVKVEYRKDGKLSCSLVPIQTNPVLLQAYLSSANSTCKPAEPTSGAPASGTSGAPTTAAPITAAPTTAVPTTTAPTTAAPTTAAPTTAAPTTTAPTTAAPTTAAPTTAAPTTTAPTTAAPTTAAPTTAEPTTAAPTTAAPTTTATEPPTTVPLCPEGWTAFESSCFLVSDESGTYGDGWNFCRARGGVLASVRSQAEQDFVTGLLPGSVWIGLSDGVAEGAFAWADASTSSYTNFYPGEPSGSGGHPDEDCVELRAAFGFAWNDEWCGTRNRYLCRIDV